MSVIALHFIRQSTEEIILFNISKIPFHLLTFLHCIVSVSHILRQNSFCQTFLAAWSYTLSKIILKWPAWNVLLLVNNCFYMNITVGIFKIKEFASDIGQGFCIFKFSLISNSYYFKSAKRNVTLRKTCISQV